MKRVFSLMIDCDNAAFGDNETDIGDELGRILSDLGSRFQRQLDGPDIRDGGRLIDVNGNSVGMWNFVDPEAS